jgi:hypothetical protein
MMLYKKEDNSCIFTAFRRIIGFVRTLSRKEVNSMASKLGVEGSLKVLDLATNVVLAMYQKEDRKALLGTDNSDDPTNALCDKIDIVAKRLSALSDDL